MLLAAATSAQISIQIGIPTYMGGLGGYSKHINNIRNSLEQNRNQADGPSFNSIQPGFGLGLSLLFDDIYVGMYWQKHNHTTNVFNTPHINSETTNQYRLEMRFIGIEAAKEIYVYQKIKFYALAGLEAGLIRHRYRNQNSDEWLSQRPTTLSTINDHSSIQLNLGMLASYPITEKLTFLVRTGFQTGQPLSNKRGSSGWWSMAPLPYIPGSPPQNEQGYREQFGVTLEEMKDEFASPMNRFFLDLRLAWTLGKQ
jgi:hypothetical protein